MSPRARSRRSSLLDRVLTLGVKEVQALGKDAEQGVFADDKIGPRFDAGHALTNDVDGGGVELLVIGSRSSAQR